MKRRNGARREATVFLILGLAAPTLARAQPAFQPAPPASAAPSPPSPSPPPPPPAGSSPWVVPYAPPGGPPPGAWGPPGMPPGPGPGWGGGWGPPARQVFVELRSDDPRTRIDRVVEGSRIPVCFIPCRKMLDANSVYVIEGDGVRSTSKFQLPDDRDSVTLDVQAGSTARLAGGAILLGAGLLTAYIGIIVWEAGAIGNFNPGSTTNADRATRVGETMVIIGLPATLLGLYLAVTTHTTVTSSSGATFTRETPTRRWPRLALTPRGLEF